jgi:sirohydrochlorin cobaltochelatase
MKAYVLAMHGAPPTDFPRQELKEYFQLHSMAEGSHEELPPKLQARMEELSARMRGWPRTSANDPFHSASHQLGEAVQAQSGCPVHVGFNEFCDPDIETAIQAAIAGGATRVIVLTPMLTRGGEHAERDIPLALERARRSHPHVELEYAWPYPVDAIARFLLSAAEDGQ